MEGKVKMSKIGKYSGLVAVALLVIAVLLPACAPSEPEQQFTLRIGLVGTLSSLPYYVMRDQGFDKQNGLTIVETIDQSADLGFNAIADGSLDGSSSGGTVNVVLAVQNGIMTDKVIAVSTNSFADPEHPIVGVVVANSLSKW